MTLGTAASRSMKNSRVSETLAGASSARKMAAPMPRGTAMSRATIEVTNVPKMKGSAPNSPALGSQTRVAKKAKPNLWRARTEPCQSSKTKSRVMSTTEAANKNVISRTISSPSRRRLKKDREPTRGSALGRVVLEVDISSGRRLLDAVESLYFFCDHFLGQLCVGKSLGIVLPVGQHPLYETLDSIALGAIREFSWNEQPGKTGDGICRFAWGIRDGNAEVVRHALCGAGGRGRHARKIGLDERAGRILHGSVGHLILDGINQLDVAKAVGCLLDQPSHAFIAFSAETNRPVHGSAFAYLAFPLVADLGEVIGPNVGCAATIRTMNHDDVVPRKIYALVRAGDCRIIPFGNFSEKDSRQRLGSEIQICCDARDVVGGDDGAENRGEVQNGEAVLVLESL